MATGGLELDPVGFGLNRARGSVEELRGEAARLGARRNEAGAARFGRRGAGDELCSRRARREREEGERDRREEKLPVLAKDKGDAH